MKNTKTKVKVFVTVATATFAITISSISFAAEQNDHTKQPPAIEAIASGTGLFEIPEHTVISTTASIQHAQELYEIRRAEEARLAEEARRAEEARLAEEASLAEEQLEAEQIAAADQELLAALIFCEAGNQPYEGQVAVGAVVMNRVHSNVYPNSIAEVIYQSGQFTPAMTGWLDTILTTGGYSESAMQAAADALAGSNPIGEMLYFDCGGYGYQIGDHFFH